jgi:antitoxin component YwqK of YwqJK toxin-antitoxin module
VSSRNCKADTIQKINTMEAKIDYSKIEFSLNHPDYEPEYQHGNIKAAIKLYEEGKIDGMQRVYIKDGKIVSRAEAFKGPSPSMGEGLCHH